MAYAHHMVPMPLVTFTANQALNLATAPSCGSWSLTVIGPRAVLELLLGPVVGDVVVDKSRVHRQHP